MKKLPEIQEQLKKNRLDGWLLYDFQNSNSISKKILGVQGNLLTRRWFCWIPVSGPPEILCHLIEKQSFTSLGLPLKTFKCWEEMLKQLETILAQCSIIAMEYSPNCAIPYVSRVDGGTLEILKSLGKTVISSANLVQFFEARWNAQQLESHLKASALLMEILKSTFAQIRNNLRDKMPMTEFSLQQFMMQEFGKKKLTTYSPPILAVNANSGNPHYEPSLENSSTVQAKDILLIDWWAKMDEPESVYADYTWMGYLGEVIPDSLLNIWNTVKASRNAALQFIQRNYPSATLQGWQVDDAARSVIKNSGYGDFFIHRTGHNIGEQVHGNGANMDNFETHDQRELIPQTCFSLEPGIYLPEFGVRSEINVYLGTNQVIATGDPIQVEIERLF
jgi:Xaa-Pro dipeptidase